MSSPRAPSSGAETLVAHDQRTRIGYRVLLDAAAGRLYIGEEDRAIWRYDATPGAGTTRTAEDHTTAYGGRLAADVEGLTLAGGHLFASSQGESKFADYDASTNAFEGKFAINAGNGIDGATGTDGIDATAQPLGPKFPDDAFIAQDGNNTDPVANDNFKVVPFEAIFPVVP